MNMAISSRNNSHSRPITKKLSVGDRVRVKDYDEIMAVMGGETIYYYQSSSGGGGFLIFENGMKLLCGNVYTVNCVYYFCDDIVTLDAPKNDLNEPWLFHVNFLDYADK